MDHGMRKAQLDIDSLQALLRKKNVFSIAEVEYAIFETDGNISVLKNEMNQSLTKKDMNIKQNGGQFTSVPMSIISDGKINKDNLKKLNLDEQWLHEELKASDIHSISDVFYAEVQKDGSLYIDKYDDMVH